MNSQYDKRFLISGLIMLVLGLLAPIYSPYALAKIGILQAHLIGALQALVFFSFAWMWPQLSLPRFTKSIATYYRTDFSSFKTIFTHLISEIEQG